MLLHPLFLFFNLFTFSLINYFFPHYHFIFFSLLYLCYSLTNIHSLYIFNLSPHFCLLLNHLILYQNSENWYIKNSRVYFTTPYPSPVPLSPPSSFLLPSLFSAFLTIFVDQHATIFVLHSDFSPPMFFVSFLIYLYFSILSSSLFTLFPWILSLFLRPPHQFLPFFFFLKSSFSFNKSLFRIHSLLPYFTFIIFNPSSSSFFSPYFSFYALIYATPHSTIFHPSQLLIFNFSFSFLLL